MNKDSSNWTMLLTLVAIMLGVVLIAQSLPVLMDTHVDPPLIYQISEIYPAMQVSNFGCLTPDEFYAIPAEQRYEMRHVDEITRLYNDEGGVTMTFTC